MSKEYFCGTQAAVFINEVWVDDAAAYNIAVQESKSPIYGYGSQFYDFVAKGIVSISGTLVINYRHPNYLYILLSDRKRRSVEQNKKNAVKSKLDLATTQTELFGQLNTLSNLSDNEMTEASKYYKDKYWDRASGKSTAIDTLDHDPFEMYFTYGLGSTGVIEKIEGVELMGRSKIIESNGQPVQEQYNFIARRYI